MCEPQRSRGQSLRAAVAVLAAVAVAAVAVKAAVGAAAAIGVTVLAACAVATVCAVVFVARHGGFGVVVKREAVDHTVIRAELLAPPKAIAPARVLEGVIIEKEAVR